MPDKLASCTHLLAWIPKDQRKHMSAHSRKPILSNIPYTVSIIRRYILCISDVELEKLRTVKAGRPCFICHSLTDKILWTSPVDLIRPGSGIAYEADWFHICAIHCSDPGFAVSIPADLLAPKSDKANHDPPTTSSKNDLHSEDTTAKTPEVKSKVPPPRKLPLPELDAAHSKDTATNEKPLKDADKTATQRVLLHTQILSMRQDARTRLWRAQNAPRFVVTCQERVFAGH